MLMAGFSMPTSVSNACFSSSGDSGRSSTIDAVRAKRLPVDRLDGDDLEVELGRGLGERRAAGARVLVGIMHVEQDAGRFGERQLLADLFGHLGQRLDDFRLDFGDAQQHRAERAVDDAG